MQCCCFSISTVTASSQSRPPRGRRPPKKPQTTKRIHRARLVQPAVSPPPTVQAPSEQVPLPFRRNEDSVLPPEPSPRQSTAQSQPPSPNSTYPPPTHTSQRKRRSSSVPPNFAPRLSPSSNDDAQRSTSTPRKPRRRRTRTPDSNRSFSSYMDEISSTTLLEHREIIKLSTEIRAGVAVEEARRKLMQRLKRRPSIPEIAASLKRTPEQVQDAMLRGTAAKNRLVASNLRLVSSVCRKISDKRGGAFENSKGIGSTASGLAFDDMVQEGSVGLIRAAEKYDASLGYKFSTYATWWIRAAVMRAITSQSRSIRVPSTVVDDYQRIKKEYERQRQLGIIKPSEKSVAQAIGITPAKLRFVVNVVTRTTASLDLAVGAAGDPTTTQRSLSEFIEGDDHVEERMVEDMQKRELDRALKLVLMPTERAAVRLRFGLDDGHPRTLREIGRMLGLSKERVRQISFQALAKLNTPEIRETLSLYE